MIEFLVKSVLNHNDHRIDLIRMTSGSGAYMEVINYGATIVSIFVPDKNGVLDNVVLKYEDFSQYMWNKALLGATVGRVANRIAGAHFTLNGITYNLDKNDGKNSIHGGFNGFHTKIFNYQTDGESLILSATSDDGEGGFPGRLDFEVKYSFSDDNVLSVEYTASSDKITPVNFTNHSYFNLSGRKTVITDDELKVNATRYAESGNEFLPTGKILPLAETAFAFREYTRISDRMAMKSDNLKGYNAYFFKDANHDKNMPLASFRNIASGRVMDTYTSMSGILIYTGDFLSETFSPFEGICFEAQYPPDAVNHPHFCQNILYPGETKKDTVTYHFYIIQ
ncbi:MAG: galactose mutarotase [Tannerella sp.]|jgi:aldose 1-epimerase|nr:galactose mutarotase [Tannerella sp.]